MLHSNNAMMMLEHVLTYNTAKEDVVIEHKGTDNIAFRRFRWILNGFSTDALMYTYFLLISISRSRQ